MRVEHRLRQLVNVFAEGGHTRMLRNEMDRLEVKWLEIEKHLADVRTAPVLLHPNMAQRITAK